jgi:hypothetical protein
MIGQERLSLLNTLLVCAIVVVGALLMWNIATFKDRYNLDAVGVTGLLLPELTVNTAVDQGEHEQLKENTLTKKLFRPLIKPQTIQKDVLTVDILTRDLLLIGVVKQEVPEAIIKNRRTRQTYFVKQGSSLGQVMVESIQDDKVVVSYQGAKKDLFIQ